VALYNKKWKIYQEEIKILNVHEHKNRVLKYLKQTQIKRSRITIIKGIYTAISQELVNKYKMITMNIENLKNKQTDLNDVHRTQVLKVTDQLPQNIHQNRLYSEQKRKQNFVVEI
jgi:hypothetical protein